MRALLPVAGLELGTCLKDFLGSICKLAAAVPILRGPIQPLLSVLAAITQYAELLTWRMLDEVKGETVRQRLMTVPYVMPRP